jgi:hypothetical protein
MTAFSLISAARSLASRRRLARVRSRDNGFQSQILANQQTNVFAYIGPPNPEREQLKAYLTLQIYRIITSRGLREDS